MKTVFFLSVLVVAVLVLMPGQSNAEIPYCDDVEPSCFDNYSHCVWVDVQWGTCGENEKKTWRCVWLCNFPGQGYTYEYGGLNECWCAGTHPACDCMLAGTLITLADGRTKPVEAIQSGDQVLAYDESTGAMVRSLVLKTHTPLAAPFYFIINERLRVTENHPFLSQGAWVAAGSLKIGDRLTSADGQSTPVFSLRKVVGKVKVFNFQVAASTYVADGIVVHNKEQCEEYQQWCPDCE